MRRFLSRFRKDPDVADWESAVRMPPDALKKYAAKCWDIFWHYKLPASYERTEMDLEGNSKWAPSYPGTPMFEQPQDVISQALKRDPHLNVSKGGCPFCRVAAEDIRAEFHPCPMPPWKSDPGEIYQVYGGQDV